MGGDLSIYGRFSYSWMEILAKSRGHRRVTLFNETNYLPSISSQIDSTQSDNVDDLKDTETTERVIAVICWVVTGVTFLAVCCLYSRIQLAIAIIKAAADYVRGTLTVLLVPPAFLAALLVFYVYWTITAVYLVSSGDPERLSTLPVGTFEFNSDLVRLLIYHLFALLWCNAFINACCLFVIASSVCIWYFSQGTGQVFVGSIR